MLVPADLIAAKLLVQMGDITPAQARAQLRATAADPNTEYDFVNRLAWELVIEPEQYERIRYFVAKFEYIRQEAMFLHQLERRGLAKDAVYSLLARIEREAYRARLGDLLVDLGVLTLEQQQTLERDALAQAQRNDAQVLAHYTGNDFADVDQPLLPNREITEDVFRLPILFRSERTLKIVRSKLDAEAQAAAPPASEAAAGPTPVVDPFLEPTVTAEAVVEVDDERTKKMHRARLEPEHDSKTLQPRAWIGPYEILEQLGAGCFGSVYLGRRAEHEMVAIKLLTGDEDASERKRFRREAKLLARFDHPNVIRLIDQGTTDDGKEYLALPAIAGQTLRELYRDEGIWAGLEPARAIRYFEHLLGALQHIHEQQVVHRDVKPENILIVYGADDVKLVDFGIARPVDQGSADIFKTSRGSISGSPAYIAPETISGSPIDGRTDLYSAGVVLFEMLTGKKPLRADTPYAFLKEHMVGVPQTLARAKPSIDWPEELERLVARLLAKLPKDRPDSAQEVLDALRFGLAELVAERATETKAPDEATDKRATSVLNRFFLRPGDPPS